MHVTRKQLEKCVQLMEACSKNESVEFILEHTNVSKAIALRFDKRTFLVGQNGSKMEL